MRKCLWKGTGWLILEILMYYVITLFALIRTSTFLYLDKDQCFFLPFYLELSRINHVILHFSFFSSLLPWSSLGLTPLTYFPDMVVDTIQYWPPHETGKFSFRNNKWKLQHGAATKQEYTNCANKSVQLFDFEIYCNSIHWFQGLHFKRKNDGWMEKKRGREKEEREKGGKKNMDG